MATMNILILGGTAEARALAERLVAEGHEVTSSLAGRTRAPVLPAGAVRQGGFGGVEGLAAYLRAQGVDRLIDATHPYAGVISNNAVAAARQAGVTLLRHMRPAWTAQSGDDWTHFASAEAAASALPSGAQVLLSTGHAGLSSYLARRDCRLLVRVIELPDTRLPAHATLLPGRPPYSLAHERALMDEHGITHLVSKNSGGAQTAAKLTAARELGVKVFMLDRPAYAPAWEVESVEAVLAAVLA